MGRPNAEPVGQDRGPDTDASASVSQTPIATEQIGQLYRDLRTSAAGLAAREARRRLVQWGPNALESRRERRWVSDAVRQLTHPLALLLWGAGVLAFAVGIVAVGVAIVIVIALNAVFADVQERQAERAVEALRMYLPDTAHVLRDGAVASVATTDLVPGDVIVIAEGERISADARLIEGALEVDMSALTGESEPVVRAADLDDRDVPVIEARELVFSGSECVGGTATALVVATGMRTELGRIASLSERVDVEPSPLERQVRRVAWVIAAVAVGLGAAFVPIAMLAADLPFTDAVVFGVGLLVGNVPEGLLPVITLALAVGVRDLAKRGAIVKRLSAVETLGSTDVICTDKTGTLTQNRMTATELRTPDRTVERHDDGAVGPAAAADIDALLDVVVFCNDASAPESGPPRGDPTEIALLTAARDLDGRVDRRDRGGGRLATFAFDPSLKMMSTVDRLDGTAVLHTKGAPEAVLERCAWIAHGDRQSTPMTSAERAHLAAEVENLASRGLRVLACADRRDVEPVPANRRDELERTLRLVGFVALFDPPRPEVADAVARCRHAGIEVVVVTGDHPLTAVAIARRVGIVTGDPTVLTGADLDAMGDVELDALLADPSQVLFARTSPEAKLRIAEALRETGHVVAMTGDGVNDAPALRRADIGVAMGASGSDVAREASTMVFTDDDFATIVSGSRVAGARTTTSASSSSTSSPTPPRRSSRS